MLCMKSELLFLFLLLRAEYIKSYMALGMLIFHSRPGVHQDNARMLDTLNQTLNHALRRRFSSLPLSDLETVVPLSGAHALQECVLLQIDFIGVFDCL